MDSLAIQPEKYDLLQKEKTDRNATSAFGTIKTEYGNYMGATGLKVVGPDGNFTDDDDYSLLPVDQVDKLAYYHDRGYDNLKAKGANSLFNDWATTPIDDAALNGWDDFLNKRNLVPLRMHQICLGWLLIIKSQLFQLS